jgi:inositol phosphorylceramide mannosyltransferase catalytic subunit
MFAEKAPSPAQVTLLELLEGDARSPRLRSITTSRLMRWAAASFFLACLVLYFQLPNRISATSFTRAKQISARELLARPLSRDLHTVPRIIHQSWADDQLPAKFAKWSQTCQVQNTDWEYVLWTDEDNLALVEKHFPWFLETYNNMPGPINRADVVRNMYMYIFGGVYADLDTECLRNMNGLFADYNVPTEPHIKMTSIGPAVVTISSNRTAFLGRMGSNLNFEHSIPNAWMGSSPGHPLWLLVIEEVAKADRARNGSFAWPEDLTGPTRLFDLVKRYVLSDDFRGEKLDRAVKDNPTLLRTYGVQSAQSHKLEILPGYKVYPFSWGKDGNMVREWCEVNKENFDPCRCKQLLATDHWPSYTITYWSHSWGVRGHNKHNVELLDEKKEA